MSQGQTIFPKKGGCKSRLFFVLVLFLFGTMAKAQGDMRFFGTATKGGSPLPGATVAVLMDGKQIYNLTTGKNGKFKFTIDVGHSYRINYSAPGCVDMYMTMDLHTPPDKAWVYPDYAAEIPFFVAGDPKMKTELFAQKPFIKIIFDGNKGFYDDPSYHFAEEIFKNPADEQKKRDELAKKEAEEKARLAAQEKLRKDEEDRQRLAKEEEDRRKKEEEDKKNKIKVTNPSDKEKPEPTTDPSMETDAIKLEKEKQEKLEHEKTNKTIRANYENNLLKLVAESERQNNLQKFNKMKEDAQGSSVVEVLRKEAQVKGENDFLMEKMKEKQKQTLANKQVKEEHLKQLIQTAAKVDRDDRASRLKPVAASQNLNYAPSPNVVVTTEDNFIWETKSTVISWANGTRTIFSVDEYWWGSRYYYHDGVEIDEKTYDAELFRHKRK